MTRKKQFLELVKKYQNGTLSAEERRLLDAWYNRYGEESKDELDEAGLAETESLLRGRLPLAPPAKIRRLWPRIAAAASILLILSAGAFLIIQKQAKPVIIAQHDIAPGHNRATLTLAGGKQIALTKKSNGTLAVQGATTIIAGGGAVTYTIVDKENMVSYNTLSTARGEASPFPLVLADGTKVWLNAQSKLTFPTVFNGKERIVELTGEAYFEVKHNAAQPFKVKTANQTVEDLGTAFNVSAYIDEKATLTTLVEGSVKVNNKVLKPGQQTDGEKITEVNTSQYLAWKNGDFDFENNDIRTIMRQLGRWYEMDVDYQGTISTDGFSSLISRQHNISSVLKLLERTGGVHFKITGRRVTVSQ
ncbi:FecR family protein [Mucilaginibacter corticis]|uniref:FecR family protein n=1 Tax=Mucilaginibacter corticis TaxID=2597670 RepID=A0A556M9R2_9SPHI|nr:FecR family protein [Mucilaginibacter corticis]TSJ36601.1 FecR family protein [Mucilaginibacter corticis]